jgi:heavy metal translocating P-type ATPase
MMAAIGNATKRGILIKSGAAVEAVARIDTLVMDKTGTLTYGKLQVEEIEIIGEDRDRASFVSLVASAEKFSEHPLGKAVLAYAQSQGIHAKDPQTFEMQTGKGIIATVDGRKILIGEKIIGQELLHKTPQALTFVKQMQKEGKTVLPVASDGKIIGIISIADVLRKEVRSTIAELKKTGLTRIVMLTGDHQAVANSIGQAAGMTDIFASQLPEDKVDSIRNLADQGHSVGMVGDGVNDAPALATASVGIVMGAIGSDVAMEAADIALMSDDLSRLPFLIRLCRKTRSRIVFNIVVSMFINFGAIILAGFGLLNPVTAALVHNFGSVFVVINSALLLTYKEQDQYPLITPALVTNGSHVN